MPTNNVTDELIKIFRSLFSGRDNVYGIMGSEGPLCIRNPLTDPLLLKHFTGAMRIGRYGILRDDTVQWAVIDVDEDKKLPKDKAVKKSKEEATKVYATCLENNLFCYLEKSRSKGFHIWIFFDEPISAGSVRRSLSKILKGIAIDCEVFPKQDMLTSDNGVGNFVFFPFHGESAKEGRTVFLNSQFQPYDNQWEHLSKIHRTKAENILSLYEKLPPEPKYQTSPHPNNTDRLKKIMECAFLQHCDKDRVTLSEPQWYGAICILSKEPGGRELIHSLSKGYPGYSPRETDDKILHSLSVGPLTCNRIKTLFDCGQECEVKTPLGLAFKNRTTVETIPSVYPFPKHAIGGLAGEFADLYSTYLESPWSFFAFSFLTCLGSLLGDRITLGSEISPQPRLYTVNLGESADDRKSESIKKTIGFFDAALTDGSFKVCHGVGSAEGLAKKLGEIEEPSKKLLLVYDELKSFVGKASIEGATLLPATNSLFEGNRFHSATKTHSIKLDDVYLSLLGASTIETFSRMWTPAFLDIGFLNRLWLVRDHGERRFSIPKEIPSIEVKTLHRKLGDILKRFPHFFRLPITDDARTIFDEWYLNGKPSPFTKRLDTYGLRLMILLTVNEGNSKVTEDTATKVVELLNWQLRIRREVDPIDAEGSIARLEELIRRALSDGPLHKRELQRKVNYQRVGIFAWNNATNNLIGAKEIFYDQKVCIYRTGG